MKEKHTFSPASVGGTSLLAIFGILCLTVLSLLTLSTAQAEKRLSDSSAQAAAAYYTADTQAEILFASLRSGESPEGVHWDGNICSYRIPISDHQALLVRLRNDDSRWTVLVWQAIPVNEPEIQQTLSLWDGTTPQEVTP